MSASPLVSVVVPVLNGEEHVGRCLRSVVEADRGHAACEVVVVDDGSTDSTQEIVRRFIADSPVPVRLLRTMETGGPGVARNVGLGDAVGEWILFLDADDELAPGAIHSLSALRRVGEDVDLAVFDWRLVAGDGATVAEGARRDFDLLEGERERRLASYLALRCDGSVVFTAIRRSLLDRSGIRFEPGFHEDVDFLFKVHHAARGIVPIREILYVKHDRPGSIVNTFSSRHIDGFFRAYAEMAGWLRTRGELDAYASDLDAGLIGVVATRLRWLRAHPADSAASDLLRRLYARWQEVRATLPGPPGFAVPFTRYQRLADALRRHAEKGFPADPGDEFGASLDRILAESWSCQDLQGSLFLGPNEIRACCKRFFRDGRRRGDVVLLPVENGDVAPADILKARLDLLRRINAGEDTECTGCPFLRYQSWKTQDALRVEHLSLEHHSRCNLRCSYCSETYYGGKDAVYDVHGLLASLADSGALDACRSIVWGGGEPLMDKAFLDTLEPLAWKDPPVRPRILSNSLIHSPRLETLLRADRIRLTTSVDAGTQGTFEAVRGGGRLVQVLENLRRYVAASPDGVTVKYIFVPGRNDSFEEVQAFASAIREFSLEGAVFQISCDFRGERVETATFAAMLLLHALLLEGGCRLSFFDDLVVQRFPDVDESQVRQLRDTLGKMGAAWVLEDPAIRPEVIVWGAGEQARSILSKSVFFRSSRVAFFVDDLHPERIGTEFEGREIRSVEDMLGSDLPILVQASQATPAILARFRELGIPEERRIRGVVV